MISQTQNKCVRNISEHLSPSQTILDQYSTMSCQIIPDSLRLSILVGSEAGCIRFGKRLIFRFLLDSWVDSTWPYMAQPCPTARFGSHMLVLWNPNMTQTYPNDILPQAAIISAAAAFVGFAGFQLFIGVLR